LLVAVGVGLLEAVAVLEVTELELGLPLHPELGIPSLLAVVEPEQQH
jgi:hypothetical protein